MIKNLFNLFKHPLFAGSAVMIIGSNFNNSINYIYHLVMGRLLSPDYYGELVSLISLEVFLIIVPASINLAIVKFVASQKKETETKRLITWLNRNAFLIAVFFTLGLLIASPLISDFLRLTHIGLFLLVAFSFLFIIPIIINRAVLQGLLRFNSYIITLVLESLTKFVVGVALVIIGLKVFGAVIGLAFSLLIGFIITQFFVRNYMVKIKKIKINPKPLMIYAVPVTLASFATTSFFTLDLILVKHFFPPTEAGWYSALSALSRVILFGAGPINLVMFPLVAKKHSENQNPERIFYYSFTLTSLIIVFAVLFYWFFPSLIINTVFGNEYLPVSNLLGLMAIFMGGVTLITLLVNYFLSFGKTKIVAVPLLGVLTQALGIWFFHDNLSSIILMFILIVTFVLLVLFTYFVFFSIQMKRVRLQN